MSLSARQAAAYDAVALAGRAGLSFSEIHDAVTLPYEQGHRERLRETRADIDVLMREELIFEDRGQRYVHHVWWEAACADEIAR